MVCKIPRRRRFVKPAADGETPPIHLQFTCKNLKVTRINLEVNRKNLKVIRLNLKVYRLNLKVTRINLEVHCINLKVNHINVDVIPANLHINCRNPLQSQPRHRHRHRRHNEQPATKRTANRRSTGKIGGCNSHARTRKLFGIAPSNHVALFPPVRRHNDAAIKIHCGDVVLAVFFITS